MSERDFPRSSAVKNLSAVRETREMWVRPLVGTIPWRRAWQPTLVFLAGESHGQRSLADNSPWVTESDTTEATELPLVDGQGHRRGACAPGAAERRNGCRSGAQYWAVLGAGGTFRQVREEIYPGCSGVRSRRTLRWVLQAWRSGLNNFPALGAEQECSWARCSCAAPALEECTRESTKPWPALPACYIKSLAECQHL